VAERLSKDLRAAFPSINGVFRADLMYMRSLSNAYSHPATVHQVVRQTLKGHNVLLIDKAKDPAARLGHAQQTILHG
jgi:hypothetical protein